MKYPGDISGAEYAAMEEGYEQGLVAGRVQGRSEGQAELDRAQGALDRVEALAARWESAPEPVHGWDSGLSATEAGERLGAWHVLQRRAAELREALG